MNTANLDLVCAEYGDKIAKKIGNEVPIMKSLGVLQEDGVYAFFLYCQSKGEKDIGSECYGFLKDDRILKTLFNDSNDLLKAVREVFKDKLNQLLFAKELLERTLIYARYHAKALGGD